ncbi:uvrD/REP helicase N-terminal domain protein, partial [Mycobacterium xenopi 3993]
APDQVLGLTFTRKAAGQLLRRVRSRLAAWPPGCDRRDRARPAPTVSTYHAFAGAVLREHGLLLPVEPDTRLLGETELWQLAFDVVSSYRGELRTDKSPPRSPRWCCGCGASSPNTLSTPNSCATPTKS